MFHPSSGSQSSDEYRNGDRDQSSAVKRRKISMAEYIGNKKPITTSSSIVQPTEDILSDIRIEEIYAEFNANGSGLAAIAPDLATTVNKKLTQSNRNEFIAHDQTIKPPIVEKTKGNHDDIWQEDEDDEDEEDFPEQQTIKPVKNIPTPSTDQKKTQKVQEEYHSL